MSVWGERTWMVGVAGQDSSRKMWMEAMRDGLVEKPSSSELAWRASGREGDECGTVTGKP